MIKLLSEIGPIAAFLLGFLYGDIYVATLYTIIASAAAVSICYLTEGKLNNFSLVSSSVLIVSGGITLLTGNSMFIKMKPTVLYVIFGSIFFITYYKKAPFMKYLLGHMFTLKAESHWLTLGFRFGLFFFVMAVANELVWRNFSDLIWVEFKVLAVLPITAVFILAQVPFILRNRIDQ